MPTIFINYRRDDSAGYAGRIHERLASLFGSPSVFMDLDDIQPGVDFVRAIEKAVVTSEAMLVLIGKRWLDSRDSSGHRRIDDPGDFVRIEIAKALDSNIRVIPVLVNHASMPAETDLPDDLRRLAHLQALEISEERWEYDIGQLVRVLGGQSAAIRGKRNRFVRPAICALALAGVVVILLLWFAKPSRDISGRWVAEVQYDFGGRHSEAFVFQVDGDTLGGTASFLGVARGILQGRIKGDRISFLTRTEEAAGDQSRPTQHAYQGTIAGDEIRLVMQTEGGFSDHPPIQLVARRMSAPSELPGKPRSPPVRARPWSEAQAIFTLNDGQIVKVRAETLSNCISTNHGLDFTSGQSVPFEKIERFDVLRAETWLASNGKASLRVTFLDGGSAEESVGSNCDLAGYNDRGRFAAILQNVKRVEFER